MAQSNISTTLEQAIEQYATVLQRLVQATNPATPSAVTPPKSENTEQPAATKLHSTVGTKTPDTGNSLYLLSPITPVKETAAENQSLPALILEVLTHTRSPTSFTRNHQNLTRISSSLWRKFGETEPT
ncbi:hypothetical protein NSTCB13_06452 [Nostoc sp. DSM 114160]|jgi:hypothetical protein